MPARWLVIVACVLGAGACKEEPPAAAAEETPEERRKRECERFATEMARTGLVAGQVLVTALDDDPASASKGRDEMRQVAREIRRDIRLALGGSWLAVAYEQTVLAIPLPPVP